MIWPGGAAPVGGESGNAVAAACPLTKKTPSSWSSSGPPSEPAAAAVITPATRFNARDFLNAVCETAKQTFPQEFEIDCEADAMQLSNDAAMPLALIANELLTN